MRSLTNTSHSSALTVMPFVAFINFLEVFAAQDFSVSIASVSLVIVFESIDSDLTARLKLLELPG